MHLSELKALHVSQLLEMATGLEIDNANRMRKQELMFAILKKRAKGGEQIFGDGTLEVLPDGFGFLRSPETSYLASTDDIYISPSQIRRFNLHTGDSIEGEVRTPKDGERYFALVKVDKVNDQSPESTKHRILFENLTPLFPDKPLMLERDMKGEENLTGRLIDLIAPIGKGQRGLLVSSPKSGKTVLMQHIAHAIAANHPDVILIVLLIDERPEEVTEMQRSVRGRSRRLDLRRTGHAPRPGGRNGDRKSQAPGRTQEGRRHPARLDHAPGTRLQHGRAGVRQGADRRCGCQRVTAAQALLRRRAQHRGRWLAHDHRHRADRHRIAHGRRHLRGVQGHRQHGNSHGAPAG